MNISAVTVTLYFYYYYAISVRRDSVSLYRAYKRRISQRIWHFIIHAPRQTHTTTPIIHDTQTALLGLGGRSAARAGGARADTGKRNLRIIKVKTALFITLNLYRELRPGCTADSAESCSERVKYHTVTDTVICVCVSVCTV